MSRHPRSRLSLRELDAKGVSTIGFALVVSFLCLLAVGVMDLGIALWDQMEVGNAARAGAEYAASYGCNQSAIQTAATSATGLSSISAIASESCGCPNSSTGITSASCGSSCSGGGTAGTYVTVNTSATYSTIITYPGIPVHVRPELPRHGADQLILL
jgi:Flp pilus assembly protein TadG